ncbi:protein kinase [Streptomyces sp. NPDC090445]|uniref:protein kinase n=1 Tax=Streptomyces sp. NPDC090445 TaxID=3365963 RepID=UPI0038193AB4
MDDYAGRILAGRYRLPLPPSDEYELVETRAFDTRSGQEVLVRQVPLPEIVDAELLDEESGGAGAARAGARAGAGGGGVLPAGELPAVRRAIAAAQAAASVPDHPRLDQVFDVFAEGGSLWIVSELVPARPLAALLADEPMTPYRAAEVAADVLTALRVLHAHGWTHRNITVRTVLICDDGRVVLTGLAAGAAEDALCGYDPVPPEDDTADAGQGWGTPPPPGREPAGLPPVAPGYETGPRRADRIPLDGPPAPGAADAPLVAPGYETTPRHPDGAPAGPHHADHTTPARQPAPPTAGLGHGWETADGDVTSPHPGPHAPGADAPARTVGPRYADRITPDRQPEPVAAGDGWEAADGDTASPGPAPGDPGPGTSGLVGPRYADHITPGRPSEPSASGTGYGRETAEGGVASPQPGPGAPGTGAPGLVGPQYADHIHITPGRPDPAAAARAGVLAAYRAGSRAAVARVAEERKAAAAGAAPAPERQPQGSNLPQGYSYPYGTPGTTGPAPGTAEETTPDTAPAAGRGPEPGADYAAPEAGPGVATGPAEPVGDLGHAAGSGVAGLAAADSGDATSNGVGTGAYAGAGSAAAVGTGGGAGGQDIPDGGVAWHGATPRRQVAALPAGQQRPEAGQPVLPAQLALPQGYRQAEDATAYLRPGQPGQPRPVPAHIPVPKSPTPPAPTPKPAPPVPAHIPVPKSPTPPAPTPKPAPPAPHPVTSAPPAAPANPARSGWGGGGGGGAGFGPSGGLDAERARQTRMAVVGAVTERWAPEQAGTVSGPWQLAAPVGPATDLWALGALLYRAVQGHAPYPEDSVAELVEMVCAEAPAFAEECGPLRPVVESLLRQDPTERPDFEELRGWLRSLVRSAPEPDSVLGAALGQGHWPGAAAPPPEPDPARLPVVRRRGELHGRHRSPAPARRPRALGRNLLLGVLVLMAGAVAYAMLFLPGDRGEGDRRQDTASRTPVAGTQAPAPQASPPASGGSRPPSGAPESPAAPQPAAPAPPGYTMQQDPEHFEIAVPAGWERRGMNEAGQVRYTDGAYVLIVVPGRDKVEGNPDPATYQKDKEPELAPYRSSTWASGGDVKTTKVGQQLRVTGRYTWIDGNGRSVVARNFVVALGGSYHIVMVTGPQDGEGKVTEVFEKATGSYKSGG